MLRQDRVTKALASVTNQTVPLGCVELVESLCVLQPILDLLIKDLGSESALAQATNISILTVTAWRLRNKSASVKDKTLLFDFLKNQTNVSRWNQHKESKDLFNKLFAFKNIDTHKIDLLERKQEQPKKRKLDESIVSSATSPAKRTKLDEASNLASQPPTKTPAPLSLDNFWNYPTDIELSDPFPRPHGFFSHETPLEESQYQEIPLYSHQI